MKPQLKQEPQRVLSLLGQIHGEWDEFHSVQSRYHSSCIHAVLTFKDALRCDEIEQIVDRGFGGLDAFNSLLRRNAQGKFYWEIAKGFELKDNIEYCRQFDDDRRDIDDIIAQDLFEIDLPLDKRPPWRLYAFCRQQQTVLVFKFHHCISDGAGLSLVFARMVDGEAADADLERLAHQRLKQVEAESEKRKNLSALGSVFSICVQLFYMIWVLLKLIYFTFKPKLSKDWIYDRDDSALPLRKFVRTPAVKIETIDMIRKRYGGTLNDVVLGACAGALRKYAQSEGYSNVPSLWASVTGNARYFIPGGARMHFLENFGTAFCIVLPTNVDDPVQRLRKVKDAMDLGKKGFECLLEYMALGLLYHVLPRKWMSGFFQWATSGATFMLSNVRGPSGSTKMLGHEVCTHCLTQRWSHDFDCF
eukprot:TRINITY_DN3865_c0_g1_i5.p1 TRINITY_DN3865_c0_g1~~TRINITY_DN3865_c0_g1_i5.p1  ORF type:complete len:418 (-),score=107.85 TRINITY_DN3865_c0_g1_i5:1011-2264(-)